MDHSSHHLELRRPGDLARTQDGFSGAISAAYQGALEQAIARWDDVTDLTFSRS